MIRSLFLCLKKATLYPIINMGHLSYMDYLLSDHKSQPVRSGSAPTVPVRFRQGIKRIKMLTRNKVYKKIGDRLIRTLEEFENIKGVRIAYLSSDEEKKKQTKMICGECIKVNKNYEWCCRYDFMIVVYEPNVIEFNDEQIVTLIRHELHHVGVNHDASEPSFYVVPHDVEEFDKIIEEKGIYWNRG